MHNYFNLIFIFESILKVCNYLIFYMSTCNKLIKDIEYVQWTGTNAKEIETLCTKLEVPFKVYKHSDEPCDHLYVNNYLVDQYEYIVFDPSLFWTEKYFKCKDFEHYGPVYFNSLKSKRAPISFSEKEFFELYEIQK